LSVFVPGGVANDGLVVEILRSKQASNEAWSAWLIAFDSPLLHGCMPSYPGGRMDSEEDESHDDA